MTGGTESEGFESGTTRPSLRQQETGSTPRDARRAAFKAWEASALTATWYARENDLIGGWCVMPSDEPPSSGGPEVADFCTERIARHIAELHNASLAGDQVTVTREDPARAEAGEIARLKAELFRVQSAAQTLGKVITRLAQSMEAARIEMIQNGPEAAMQWILNSLPDVSDEAPEDQWDGKETATQWIDRTQAAGRAAAAGDPR